MNIKLWDALMKSDFVFDRESYLVLRQSCFHLLQHNAPELLNLKEDNVIDFLSQAPLQAFLQEFSNILLPLKKEE